MTLKTQIRNLGLLTIAVCQFLAFSSQAAELSLARPIFDLPRKTTIRWEKDTYIPYRQNWKRVFFAKDWNTRLPVIGSTSAALFQQLDFSVSTFCTYQDFSKKHRSLEIKRGEIWKIEYFMHYTTVNSSSSEFSMFKEVVIGLRFDENDLVPSNSSLASSIYNFKVGQKMYVSHFSVYRPKAQASDHFTCYKITEAGNANDFEMTYEEFLNTMGDKARLYVR